MLETDATKAADMSSATAAQQRRIAQLKRAYQRELARKATVIEKAAIDRAAVLTARAEAAAIDAEASDEDVVRLDGAAHRARQASSR